MQNSDIEFAIRRITSMQEFSSTPSDKAVFSFALEALQRMTEKHKPVWWQTCTNCTNKNNGVNNCGHCSRCPYSAAGSTDLKTINPKN